MVGDDLGQMRLVEVLDEAVFIAPDWSADTQVQTGSTINLSYIRHITILQTPISHRKMVQHKSTQTEPCDVPLPMVDSEGL